MPDAPLTFAVKGLDEIFSRWDSSWVRNQARITMGRVVKQVRSIAAKYPRQNPDSTYRRTLTLGRSISEKVEVGAFGVRGRVGTAIPYAKVVNDGHGVIAPRNAKVLSWVATKSGIVGGRRYKAGDRVFARMVRAWEGWHNFDKAFEQGKAILLHEVVSLRLIVTRHFNQE
jgi:hypothetical protein